jgi:hypothetical protein
VQRSATNGELQRWARESGLQWQAPTSPAVTGTLPLAGLMND